MHRALQIVHLKGHIKKNSKRQHYVSMPIEDRYAPDFLLPVDYPSAVCILSLNGRIFTEIDTSCLEHFEHPKVFRAR